MFMREFWERFWEVPLMAVILVYFLVQYATEPVYHLVESVRGGVKGIHGFQESGIQELDELHKVIEN